MRAQTNPLALGGEVPKYARGIGAAVYGTHVYGNLYDCDEEVLRDEVKLTNIVKEAAEKANATVVSLFYYKFTPTGGLSVVAIVAESHISIHTWPEHKYATVDVYTCGSHTDPLTAFEYIAEKLGAKRYSVNISDRSLYENEDAGEDPKP
ncbi:MAG: adenosylmethionine decarboxylase [Caldivirga sp.]|jgi:S-adenosylmethionine decarboxylase|uniref:adenosylmethionine decarboxylase n=1 Tax=Caldivirga sp. MU80 TaxID=1650354 RepID=UPI00074814D6|nr:adenosylmethionine decarboxylase [Caldivirga sp. MU80]KUO86569.1 MAG: S-adenosylmethionine decarboxylase proenzyme [Caldivirga sp. MG_3]KUO89659.1 MAG: S-adenosylmethionine decarboxylase proenzyme [Caldivirga sp. CIS_19]KUO90436.1 MAG: S-adenosylmethionine decarboxylase proenzyme [Caldivirga sp. JCHS_4]NAZ28357.1 adenosylmethionine decarboxylase [Caldivirga sp.]